MFSYIEIEQANPLSSFLFLLVCAMWWYCLFFFRSWKNENK